jgi:hypothetical protein
MHGIWKYDEFSRTSVGRHMSAMRRNLRANVNKEKSNKYIAQLQSQC